MEYESMQEACRESETGANTVGSNPAATTGTTTCIPEQSRAADARKDTSNQDAESSTTTTQAVSIQGSKDLSICSDLDTDGDEMGTSPDSIVSFWQDRSSSKQSWLPKGGSDELLPPMQSRHAPICQKARSPSNAPLYHRV
jgi:hypothetical protein